MSLPPDVPEAAVSQVERFCDGRVPAAAQSVPARGSDVSER
jgi:hypothetical protein